MKRMLQLYLIGTAAMYRSLGTRAFEYWTPAATVLSLISLACAFTVLIGQDQWGVDGGYKTLVFAIGIPGIIIMGVYLSIGSVARRIHVSLLIVQLRCVRLAAFVFHISCWTLLFILPHLVDRN